jgi:hypothetical protein
MHELKKGPLLVSLYYSNVFVLWLETCWQGDLIGRIRDCLPWAGFFENCRNSPHFGLLFATANVVH